MTKKIFHICWMSAILFYLPSITHATPFIYQFTQSYTLNDNVAEFGTAAVIGITVDNGSSTNQNQAYAWNQITALSFSTVGGLFSFAQSVDIIFGSEPNFLTTDASGNQGTFTFNANSIAQLAAINAPNKHGQIGTQSITNIAMASNGLIAEYQPDLIPGSQDYLQWTATAQLKANVPEPVSIMLIATGLLGFAASRRRKNQA